MARMKVGGVNVAGKGPVEVSSDEISSYEGSAQVDLKEPAKVNEVDEKEPQSPDLSEERDTGRDDRPRQQVPEIRDIGPLPEQLFAEARSDYFADQARIAENNRKMSDLNKAAEMGDLKLFVSDMTIEDAEKKGMADLDAVDSGYQMPVPLTTYRRPVSDSDAADDGDGSNEMVDTNQNNYDINVPGQIVSASPSSNAEQFHRGGKDARETEEAEKRKKQQDAAARIMSMVSDADETVSARSAVMPRIASDPTTYELSSDRFYQAQKEQEAQAKESVKKKRFEGRAVSDKLLSSRFVKPCDVSIGSDLISEMLRIPDSPFVKMLHDETGILVDPMADNAVEVAMKAINDSNIQVASAKSPINKTSSNQRRTLRAHLGRGIKIHPTQAKSYNADFDGDEMTVSFDREAIRRAKGSMSYLIDLDGAPTIDLDFFPVTELIGMDGLQKHNFVVDFMLDKISGDVDALANAVVELTDAGPDNVDIALVDLLREIEKKGYEYPAGKRDFMMSEILNGIYDGLRQCRIMKAEVAFARSGDSPVWDVERTELADTGIEWILDDMHAGRPPINFQEFKVVMNRFIGEKGGKNAAFRIGADIMKMVRMDKRFIETESDLKELYDKTMAMGMSMRISGLSEIGQQSSFAASMVRSDVMSKVGVPSSYDTMTEFLDNFIHVYRSYESLVNMANEQFATDFSFIGEGKLGMTRIEGRRVRDVSQALIDVYGDLSIEQMFGKFASFDSDSRSRQVWGSGNAKISTSISDMTLYDFSKRNSVKMSLEDGRSAGEAKIGNIEDGALTKSLLLAIADKKHSQASAYSNAMKGKDGLLEKTVRVVKRLNEQLAREDSTDWKSWSNDLVSLLYATGPEIFNHFGMDSPKNFVNSRFGKAMLAAKDAQKMGGIRIAMVVQYRMAPFMSMRRELDNLARNGKGDVDEIASLVSRCDVELDRLASSSQAWNAIVREMREGNAAFKALSSSSGGFGSRIYENAKSNASDYWKDPKHESIIDVLQSSMSMDGKEKILSDIVRWHEGFAQIPSHEMAYQLEQDPDSSFRTTVGFAAAKSVLGTFKTASSMIDSYERKSYETAVKNIEDAYKEFGEEAGALDSMLSMVAENDFLLTEVSDDIVADSMTSQLDKEYSQSEKGLQALAMNALYGALSYRRNGGIYTDVDRTDSFAIGMMSYDDLAPIDIVKMFADPSVTLFVFDRDGRIVEMSREILCGDTTEASLWAFLRENPRIAMMLRPNRVSINPSNSAFVTSSGSTSSLFSIARQNHGKIFHDKVKSMMIDHPEFLGLAAMTVPTHGLASRSARSMYKSSINDLVNDIIILAAKSKRARSRDVVLDYVEEGLGITVDHVIGLGVDPDVAEEFCSEVLKMYREYVSDVADVIPAKSRISSEPRKGIAIKDAESVAMYYDVKQDASGAKTEVSTAVEGTETWRLALWVSLLASRDSYDTVGVWSKDELMDKLGSQMTSDGVPLSEVEWDDKDEVAVQVPDGWVVEDNLTDSYGRPISSVARYLIIKRDDGAERFNLKIKKTGSDGTGSITKHGKVEESYPAIMSMLMEAYGDDANLFAARVKLAEHLMGVNERLGYKDMSLANYMCLADLMLVEDPLGSGLVLRSLKQIARHIKANMPESIVKNGNIEDMRQAARLDYESVDMEKGNPIDLLNSVRVAGTSPFRPVMRKATSMFDRRADAISKIVSRNQDYSIPSKKKAEKTHRDHMKKQPKAKAFMSTMFGYRFYGTVGVDAEYAIDDRAVIHIPNKTGQEWDAMIRNAIGTAKELGMTVHADNIELLGEYAADAVPVPGGGSGWIVPFLDLRMNGSMANPYEPQSALFQRDPEKVVWTFEDEINYYGSGDSVFHAFEPMRDKINPSWGDPMSISMKDLFPNVWSAFSGDPSTELIFEMAEETDILKYIVNEYPEPFSIDYGVPETAGKRFTDAVSMMDMRIAEYRRDYAKSARNGIMETSNPDRIVAWVRCTIRRNGEADQHVLAPIVPFSREGSSEVPYVFDVDNMAVVSDTNGYVSVMFDWKFSGDVDRMFYKIHEGAGAANKMTGDGTFIDGGALANGRRLDGCYYYKSTVTRRLGTNKRLATMDTLMFAARDNKYTGGYNFGETEGAFPHNRDVAEALAADRLPSETWEDLMRQGILWHSDAEINAFVENQVEKCLRYGINPSDFFASRFGGRASNVYWEFPMLYETSWGYMNSMLKYMSAVSPGLCPDNLASDPTGCLFRPCAEKESFGCLQMMIPYKKINGDGTFYKWSNVYAGWSFLGKDFAGFSRPNIGASSDFMDSLNTMLLSGRTPSQSKFRQMVAWAASDIVASNRPGMVELDTHKWIEKISGGSGDDRG